MDNYILQTLITQGRIVTSAEIDPNNSYLQVGVYQPGNRKSKAANDAYPAFAIPLSEVAGPIGVTGDLTAPTLYSKIPLAKPTNGVWRSIIFGEDAGYNNTATNSIMMGYVAGANFNSSTTTYNANFIGHQAGFGSSTCNNSNFIGIQAGQNSTNSSNSNFIGSSAGYQKSNAIYCNYIGFNTGSENSTYSNAIGWLAGGLANNSSNYNFIGKNAGIGASNSSNSTFIGENAGLDASNANNSIFLGFSAGQNAYNSSNSIFIGQLAGGNSHATNVIALGYNAGNSNPQSNRFIISNNSLPEFATRALAQSTIFASASNGSTYLYYNSTTGAIEGIRKP